MKTLPLSAELDIEPRWHDDVSTPHVCDVRAADVSYEAIMLAAVERVRQVEASGGRVSFEGAVRGQFAVAKFFLDRAHAERWAPASKHAVRRTNPSSGRPRSRRPRSACKTSSASRGDPHQGEGDPPRPHTGVRSSIRKTREP